MPKRRSRIRKKSVKKSRKRSDKRGKIRNPKTGRYVKKSGIIGKKLLAKSRKKKSKKKRRSRRISRSMGQAAGPAAVRVGGYRAPRAGIDPVIPNILSLFLKCKNDPYCQEVAEEQFYNRRNDYKYRIPTENINDFTTWWNNRNQEDRKRFIYALLKKGI